MDSIAVNIPVKIQGLQQCIIYDKSTAYAR